jgi:septal ring factor EnvC (AmiA/AmiB activator)
MQEYPNLPSAITPGWVSILITLGGAVGLGSVIKIIVSRWWDRELKSTDHTIESEKDFIRMLWAKIEKSEQEASRIEVALDKKNQELFDLRVEVEMKRSRIEFLLEENKEQKIQISEQIQENLRLRKALEDHLRDHHEFDK